MISGDSMQVYKHMDIGTAKVTRDEMDGIPHHMIDILEPDESFSAYEFKKEQKLVLKILSIEGNYLSSLEAQDFTYNLCFTTMLSKMKQSPEKCKLFMRNLQNSNNITMRSYIII